MHRSLLLTARVGFGLTCALAAFAPAHALVVDFADLTLPPQSFHDGGPTTNTLGWSSGGVYFGNSYNSAWGGFWNGFAYSNVIDTTTPGFTNQFAAYAGGALSGATGIYAVAYAGPYAFFDLPAGYTPVSVYVTNTTYAALDMLTGSAFSKKFGGPSGDDPDYFDVIFTGYTGPGATGTVTGTLAFRLADFTFADNSLDYIVDTWRLVDLTALGAPASIKLTWDSSDVGPWGINTPTYVALDQLVLVPEPAAFALAFGAATFACVLWRRRRHGRDPLVPEN